MQTVLVITDFKTAALDCVPKVSREMRHADLTFIFIHMFSLSDSITDLLMLSRRNREYEYISNEFYEKARKLEQDYHNVYSIEVDFFYGNTISMFRNYIEANNVNFILNPADCSVSKLNKSSIDATSLLEKAGVRVINLSKTEEVEDVVILNNEELTGALT